MVGENEWEPVVDCGDESSMIAFRVKAIPRLILLDKKGRVMNLKLPKPSSSEFEKILKELKGIV